ncbi:MAG: hypothetical protein V5783_01200 [Pontiella sp.]
MKLNVFQIGSIIFMAAASALADEKTYWAQTAQNPMADLMKLSIRNSYDFNAGKKEAVNFRVAFQPSMVSEISTGWNLVNRLDIPFLYQPGRITGEKDSFGLGDITYESWFGPSSGQPFFWGLGPVVQIPTATDNQIGTKKWSAGLTANTTVVRGPIVAGIRANHLWSFAGPDHREKVNRTTIEYYCYANLGNGWWIGTAPINTANWEASSNNIWTIPLGGGFGKLIGKRRPINLKFEAYSYAESPNGEADWSLMLGVDFLIPENSLFKRN